MRRFTRSKKRRGEGSSRDAGQQMEVDPDTGGQLYVAGREYEAQHFSEPQKMFPERALVFDGAEHPIYAKILATIRELQWEKLAQAPCKYDPALVTEFYIMLHEREPFSGEMYVRGRELKFSVESIREFLGARDPEEDDAIYEHTGLNATNRKYGQRLVAYVLQEGTPTDSFEGKNMIPREYLKTEVQLWQQWVQYNVLPNSHLPDL